MTLKFARMRSLWLVLCSLGVLLCSSLAFAAGRVEWKEKSPKEREGGSWRLEVAIYLPRAPDIAHVPMKFEFQPTAYYARDLLDGDKIQERVVPLQDRQSLIESVDVGFMDSGSGSIQSRTKFTFKVTRAHGYEAGEYKVTIRDGRNGNTIGTPTTLKFMGENELVDRRAMVFTGNEKKKKKEEPAEKKEEPASQAEESSASGESSESDSAASEGEGEGAEEESDPPQEIKEKPGGCGCRLEGTESGGSAAGLLALGLAGLALGRRKTRASN